MRFIDEHDFPAGLVLQVLGIAPSACYGWRARAACPPRRQREDAELLEKIKQIRSSSEFGDTCGSPRIWLELRRQGIRCGRNRVERLMRQPGLGGAYLRKGRKGGSARQDPRHVPAPDLARRNFRADAPGRLRVADLTRILTGEGVLWLASVRDAFPNRVAGWKTSGRADTALVLGALESALWSRDVRAGQLIHHSGKGCQYTAIRFTSRLAGAGIAPSTGTTGDSYGNALAENLRPAIKAELVYRSTWRTRDEADQALFRYIDSWYNPRRIQARLGGLSPDEYEAAWYAQQDPATIRPEAAGAR
jgi:putative transposase